MSWKWKVSCFYNDTVVWPKIPGELAIETVHADDLSKDMEVAACERRTDITYTVTSFEDMK